MRPVAAVVAAFYRGIAALQESGRLYQMETLVKTRLGPVPFFGQVAAQTITMSSRSGTQPGVITIADTFEHFIG